MFRFASISSLAMAAYLVSVPVPVQAASLNGKWSGSGTVKSVSGKTEHAKCKVTYKKSADSVYRMSAICATTSGKASQVATLRRTGGNKFTGKFRNAKHNINGVIYVTLNGNSQTMFMSAGEGTATIKLKKRR